MKHDRDPAALVDGARDGSHETREHGPDSDDREPEVAPLPTVPAEKYTVEGELGRGGLGRVLRAVDRAMGRVVAVKEILKDDPAEERRFVREALITGRIEHPAIVPVYEAGRWPDGKPFYSMRLISGQPLTTVARGQLGLGERLGLLPHIVTIAEAVAYAHSRGIVHRDIKPDNAIIGQFGETMVIDWGIAGELDASGRVQEMRAGQFGPVVVGTPAFMAPEQAAGEPVDVRADIYALGGLLYYVLAGTWAAAPLARVDAAGDRHDLDDTVAVDAAGSALNRTVVPLELRRPDVPPELAAIVRKAMAPRCEDRYATAKSFVEDLKRFQTGQLVGAYKYSLGSLIGRWARRHRALVGAAAVALVAVGIIGALSVARVVRAQHVAEGQRALAERQRQSAEAAQARAEASSNDLLLLNARAALHVDPTAALAWLKRYPMSAARWSDVPGLATDALSRGVAEDVWRVSRSSSEGVSFSPDGRWLAAGSVDHLVQLWNPTTGEVHALGGHNGPVNDVEISPDGRWLVSGSYDHTVRSWQLDGDGHATHARLLGRHEGSVLDVAFSPDSRWVASAGKDNLVRLWNVADGTTRVLAGHTLPVWAVAFAPDGATLASGSSDKTVRVWNLQTGRALVIHPLAPITQLVFSADGRTLVGSSENAIERWDPDSGRRLALLRVPTTLECVAVAPRGHLVAFGGADGVVRVRDDVSGQTRTLVGHSGSLEFVRFSPDGTRLASSSQDGTVRLWRVVTPAERVLPGGAHSVAFSPDGREVTVGGSDGIVRRWPLDGGAPRLLAGHRGPVDRVKYLPDGHALVSLSAVDRTLRLWNLDGGGGRVLDARASGQRIALSRDGRTIMVAEGSSRGVLLALPSGAVRCRFEGSDVGQMALSPDGALAAYSDNDEVRLLRVAECKSRVLYAHDAGLDAILFSPDGARLASSDVDKSIKLYDLASGQVRSLAGHDMEVYDLAFSADGRLLASASEDRSARLWDVSTGRQERLFRGHENGVTAVAFAGPATLATAGPDHTLRLWSLGDERVQILRGHEDTIYDLAVSPDGRLVASASGDGTTRLWTSALPADTPREPAQLRQWLRQSTSAEIDAVHLLESPTKARD